MVTIQGCKDGNPLRLQIATKVSEKLQKSGKWLNAQILWSESLQCYLIDAVEVLFGSEKFLNLVTFVTVCHLDLFQSSFFSKLHQLFGPESSTSSNPKVGQQLLLAILTSESELILQPVEFSLKLNGPGASACNSNNCLVSN